MLLLLRDDAETSLLSLPSQSFCRGQILMWLAAVVPVLG